MPKDIALRHIEITEELRSHRMEGPYYKVATIKGFANFVDEEMADKIPDAKIRTFEIVEVHGGPQGPIYFGCDIDKTGSPTPYATTIVKSSK